jgi:anthranilate synthase/aminodeoxychorismate synthase-like glutamine amidotransferase
MRILLLDNYDPNVIGLAHFLHELGADVEVYRNYAIEVEEIHRLAPARIVISPGPDEPIEAGITLPLIRELGIEIPILGIGLGCQSIAVAFGGRVIPAPHAIEHAALSIEHSGRGIFRDLPSPFTATNRSSLLVEQRRLPDALEATARDTSGLIMGIRHRTLPVDGIQFDPDTGANEHGMALLRTFLEA